MPDRAGDPRPPRAPTVHGPWAGWRRPVAGHHRATDEIALPLVDSGGTPGAEMGGRPVLETVSARRSSRERLLGALIGAGYFAGTAAVVGVVVLAFRLLVGGGEIVSVLRTLGGAAAVLAVWGFGVGLFLDRRTGVLATAHVVRDGAGSTVGLYELAAVSSRPTRDGPELRLSGSPESGLPGTVGLPLGLVEGNPQLWDLVHHGIRHSVAAGAEIDEPTRHLLDLGDEPAMVSAATPATDPGTGTTAARPTTLPPVPDDEGHPRPPTAPGVARPWRARSRPDLDRWASEPTTGVTPVLETVAGRRARGRARRALARTLDGCLPTLSLLAVAAGAVFAFGSGPYQGRGAAFIGGAVAVGLALVFVLHWFDGRTARLFAHAHLLRDDDGRSVPLYGLTSVRTARSLRGGRVLTLRGREPSDRMSVPLGLLVANPRLWDLVHHGIRHSLATGADVDEPTRRILHLP